MEIKENINIQDDKVTRGIGDLVSIIDTISNCGDEEITVNFSEFRFATPVYVVSLMLFLKSCGKRIVFRNLSPYLSTVRFHEPVRPDELGNERFYALMGRQEYKTYIPIISFPASRNRASDKDAILTAIESLLSTKLKIARNVSNGLKYIIGEMVDNITEHSGSERGYLFAQYYPKKGFMDLCIADEGITLAGSFNNAGIEVADDVEAMMAANKGISSKNLPNAENRGYGIFTSKKMLIKGLGGQYMMMSGGALYLYDSNTDQILALPNGNRWKGTIVALRLPTQKEEFDYSRYFE